MRAGVATEQGLALRDIPQPRPKPNEVLVKVRAAALNRADLAPAPRRRTILPATG
jgi:NADPH2:quinone reductase